MRFSAVLASTVFGASLLSQQGPSEQCLKIKCGSLDCKPPFKYSLPEESGLCCPVCTTDDASLVVDRYTGEFGGVGANPNADRNCAGVMCPELMCPESERIFTPEDGFDKETMCCTRCKGGGMASEVKTPSFGEESE
mmetsp:Transcript_97619/g.223718  ORF Transcript_97619/g.223718 Transcript_97619/m.223718 type:complete len:137 (-) Transcript_97619:60-470(-)